MKFVRKICVLGLGLIFSLLSSGVFADDILELKHKIETQEKAISELKLQLEKIRAGEASHSGMMKADERDFRVYWRDSVRIKTNDNQVQIRFGGRFHHDMKWINESTGLKARIGRQNDSSRFRRARMYFHGTLYENLEFMLQMEFSSGAVSLKNAFIGIEGLIHPKILIGQFQEPLSLDEMNSSNGISFLERALPNAFAPARNVGIMLADLADHERVTFSAGVFKETDDNGLADADGGANLSGRVTLLPVYEGNGKKLLHLGLAHTVKQLAEDKYRIRQRPEVSTGDYFADTGNIDAKGADATGFEAAWVNNSFSAQGEFVKSSVDGTKGQSDLDFDGYNLQCSYFLTGEVKEYKLSQGSFGGVSPLKNFTGKSGGAWEIAVRRSELDLNDKNINGGRLKTTTFGVNWYLNANTRLMWHYIKADVRDAGTADIFQMRTQFHF